MARAMKDSSNDRIGIVPYCWRLARIKHVAQLYTGNSIKDEVKELYEDSIDAIPYISSKDIDVTFRTANYENGMYVKSNDATFKVAPTGSILMCIEGGSAGKKKTRLIQNVAFVNKLCCFNPNNIDAAFLFYWLCSPNFEDEFKENISGLIGGVSVSTLQNFSIILPDMAEQRRIADFLDRKCAEIDSVIAETEKTIAEYKALKQSIITEAVTKGVRGERPMKDSGYDFIGNIPEQWEVLKLRNIGSLQNGISKGAEFFGEGYPFVSYGDVYKNMVLPQNVKGLVQSTDSEQKLYSVQYGDIFFTRTSETIEEVGFSSVCKTDIPNATFAGFLIRLRPKNDIISADFSSYYFRSAHHRFYLVKEMNLVTRASLSQSLLKNMPVLVPSKEEQAEISHYLDIKCSDINSLISARQQLLTELDTYKKSLIYEYVTGKTEVPLS